MRPTDTLQNGRPSADSPSPAALAALASRMYPEASPSRRWIIAHRPHICPFDLLVQSVPVGCSVLDVGCGSGMFLGLLAATGREPRGLGFDSSATAIELARAMAGRLAEQGIAAQLRFEQRDAGGSWPDGRFDVVSLIDVMHHIPHAHQRAVFSAARASLQPGGLLVYKDIGPRPAWRACANRLHDLVMARQWVHYRRAQDVIDWGRGLGLQVVRAERVNRLWYGHDLLLFRLPAEETAGEVTSCSV